MKTKLSMPLIIVYYFYFLTISTFLGSLIFFSHPNKAMAATATNYQAVPPFAAAGVPPLVMIVMSKNHKLFYEAYNDASDLNNDGELNIKYNPSITYFGYFDSYKQYEYNNVNGRFEPVADTSNKRVTALNRWSGDFLNYLTMTRMDCIRKVLYGGKRSTDTTTETVLERAFVPQDAHSWGKEYKSIAHDEYDIAHYTPYSEPTTAGNRHLFANTTRVSNTDPPLLLVLKNKTERIWKWVAKGAPVVDNSLGVPDDIFKVYIQVGVTANNMTPNKDRFKKYPNGQYKPIGLLQKFGESDKIYFGLISGTYQNNHSGGVLRKNIESITDEINLNTGEFDINAKGIIHTINSFAIKNFRHGSFNYYPGWSGAWETESALPESPVHFPDWGNPLAEMLYETLKYFGDGSPTTDFTRDINDGDDDGIDLPIKTWVNPYDTYNNCAKPFILAISDIYPTFDSDQLPGRDDDFAVPTHDTDGNPTGYTAGSTSGETIGNAVTQLHCKNLANTIFDRELSSGPYFIGAEDAYEDGSCVPKTIDSFGNIRGLCPEEPTKQGSYYSAAVTYYGKKEDMSTAGGPQNVSSKIVGLASPLPEINIKVGTSTIKIIPFAKSVGTCLGITPDHLNDYQPTNTLVDFFVETITETSGKFIINFEDVEQGADHDEDAVVIYTYQVLDALNNPVTDPINGTKVEISLDSISSSGCIIQHIGYIISGTENDGTYLVVRDWDLDEAVGFGIKCPEGVLANKHDVNYYLDSPNEGATDCPGSPYDSTCKALPLTSTKTFEPGATTADFLKNPLWYAAKWGSFKDTNANNIPDIQAEWDEDNDGIPDGYFYVQNPLELETQLNESFLAIMAEVANGSAASVISQTRAGEGAVYQAIFYPLFQDELLNKVSWTGETHALFVDKWGNMREDTVEDDILCMEEDYIIRFNGNVIDRYHDSDGDGQYTELDLVDTTDITKIKYIWSASEWLNSMSNPQALAQRPYTSTIKNRHIFTFIDKDEDMVADTGEQVDFLSATPSKSDLTDTSKIYPYLTLFPTFNDEPASLDTLRTADSPSFTKFNALLSAQSKRIIDYIRGQDQAEATISGYTIPAFRSRKIDWDNNGTIETWRLGDIISSSPTVVGRPSEGYHLLYRDTSYATFAGKFKNRRQVIYTGANDGMFHAFNGGFYNAENKSFDRFIDVNGNDIYDFGTDTGINFELGAELWAYIPYNLLPHLYWLTQQDYPHVYYNDLKPKIFDAKILPDGTHYSSDTVGEPNWGTFLIAGMRFGGGVITADMNKTDGKSIKMGLVDAGGLPIPDVDREMTSAYFLFDITDPEKKPTLVAELSFDGLGYTTCYPAVIPMKNRAPLGAITANDWYLVFGSGPADANGKPGIIGSGALESAISNQEAKLFVVDLKKLVLDKSLATIDHITGSLDITTPDGTDYYFKGDANSFISDPISVDYNLDYNADVLYFGTVSGHGTPANSWHGNLRRVVINNNLSTGDWVNNSIFFDDLLLKQPIVAAQSVTLGHNIKIDDDGSATTPDDRTSLSENNRWIYCGTGRFFVINDNDVADQQSYYGIKEPFEYTEATGDIEWSYIKDNAAIHDSGKVSTSTLLDVSNAAINVDSISNDITISGITGINTWTELTDEIDYYRSGWKLDFSETRERNLGQAALFGDILTFTTYVPPLDPCITTGESYLYGLYYRTGTAYFKPVLGSTNSGTTETMTKKISIGSGLAITPNIHVGSGDGTKAFIQKSTGEIIPIDQGNPGVIKSGVVTWEPIP